MRTLSFSGTRSRPPRTAPSGPISGYKERSGQTSPGTPGMSLSKKSTLASGEDETLHYMHYSAGQYTTVARRTATPAVCLVCHTDDHDDNRDDDHNDDHDDDHDDER